MLRNLLRGIYGAGLTLCLVLPAFVLPGGISTSSAQGWSYRAIDQALGKLERYVDQNFIPVRFSPSGPRNGDGILLMKLGMGIAYCKDHAASIAVRDGALFRKVAMARTLRGVTAATIGLAAARLAPGTYYIVHGYCRVGARRYNVGLRAQTHAGPGRMFRTAYARFTIEKGQVLNAGFLRFFPPRRHGRGLKIRLQSVPRADLRFLAARYPRLRERLTSRLMQRTNAAGQLLGSRRQRQRITHPHRRRDQQQAIVPSPPTVHPAPPRNPVKPPKSARKGSMTPGQRRAACIALVQLKKEGKVRKLPIICAKYNKHGQTRASSGLPPAIGPDK